MKNMASAWEPSKNFDTKEIIYYARFGKVLKHNKNAFFLQIFFYFMLSLLFISQWELISYFFSNFALYFLKDASISKRELVMGKSIYFLSSAGRLPTPLESILALVFSLLLILFNRKIDLIPLPFKIWMNFFAIILAISSIYFLLFGYAFPYGLEDFSFLYMIAQVGIFSFIPLLLGFALSLFTFSWWVIFTNLFAVFITLFYSFIFGFLRYTFFIYILDNYSFLWMANMFFNLGPLLDMIYISGIYGVYLSVLSRRSSGYIKAWKWLY